MASPPPNDLAGKSRVDVADSPRTADIKADMARKPFLQTYFGRLPPEIRGKVFVGLLASPPPYAGHDFATNPSEPEVSRKTPGTFLHIKASWYQVTRTCRQIYIESRPIFFTSKSYYLANHQDLARFLQYPTPLSLRWDTITALCVKDLVRTRILYTQEEIDKIFSDPTDSRAVGRPREQYEAKTLQAIDFILSFDLRRLKSLRTIGLCIRVGEEMDYVGFLHGLSGISKGLVEFRDAAHWLIRSQNPGDPWEIQYACFSYGGYANYAKGKDNEHIPYDVRRIQLAVTDIDSRAPGLQNGDERYVEVQIQRHTENDLSQSRLNERGSDMLLETASDHSDLGLQGSYQAQLEIPQDRSETVAGEETPEEDAEDVSDTGLEPEQNRTDQPSFLVQQSEDGPGHQTDTDTDQEGYHTLPRPASEEVFETQTKTQSEHQTEGPPSSRSSVSAAHDSSTATEIDRTSLTDTDDEDNQAQPNTQAGNYAPQVSNSQHDNRVYVESTIEAGRRWKDTTEKIKGPGVRTTIEILSGQTKKLLLDFLDTPNPYTEEETIQYRGGQQLGFVGNKEQTEKCPHQEKRSASRRWNTQERDAEAPCAASKASSPKEGLPLPALPHRSGLQSRSVRIGAVSLLFFLLVIIGHPPEWLSNVRESGKGSSQ